jgi:hypothetical protein
MFQRRNSNLITALCTGSAIIVFAFFESQVHVSSVTLDIAAAVICLLPVAVAPIWRKARRNKASNAR